MEAPLFWSPRWPGIPGRFFGAVVVWLRNCLCLRRVGGGRSRLRRLGHDCTRLGLGGDRTRLRDQLACPGRVGNGMRVIALTRVRAAAVLVGGGVVRSDLDGFGVVGYCTVDITRQLIPDSTIAIGGRVVGSALNDFRATFYPKLSDFACPARRLPTRVRLTRQTITKPGVAGA